MDDRVARLRIHQKNIDRYQDLLKTKLTETEVQYLERRLTEERSLMEMLRVSLKLPEISDPGAPS